MVEGALQEFIHHAIARGASRKDLEESLTAAGWPRELVQEYTKAAERHHPGPALIAMRDVSKRFADNPVLDRIRLDIRPGELFGIIGLSGAGKTTLLNVLVGFFAPDAGDVVLKLPDGPEVSVFKAPDVVKNMFGFAAQTPSFYAKLTVRENVEHFASLYNISPARRITRCTALLKLVGLEDAQNTLAHNLSGGMRKRLDIACALVHQPDILILDEPTADLDPLSRAQLWKLIRQIHRQGTTVIVASHFVSELERHCERIAILRDHRITEMGTPQELRSIYSTNYEIFLETQKQAYDAVKRELAKGRNKKLFPSIRQKGRRLVVQTAQPTAALAAVLDAVKKANDRVQHVHVSRPSIGEVFAALVKK